MATILPRSVRYAAVVSLIHAAVIRAGLVTVICPHCGTSQTKPRHPVTAFRVCTRCHKHFPFAPKPPPPRRKRR
jgi:hypothetical protein